tara:strand:- start:518 stop:673 length:156 start_codon:yes stop_codon:yes gene_type:complete
MLKRIRKNKDGKIIYEQTQPIKKQNDNTQSDVSDAAIDGPQIIGTGTMSRR